MALKIIYQEDVQAEILAGIILALQSGAGRDPEYLRGVITTFQYQANVFGLSWPAIVKELDAAGLGVLPNACVSTGSFLQPDNR